MLVDMVVGSLFFLIMILGLGLLGIYTYRHRIKIKKFCQDPEYGKDWHPTRETELRRNIEDAEAELKSLDLTIDPRD